MKKYVLLSVGELLVDLIGTELASSILETPEFERFQGVVLPIWPLTWLVWGSLSP
jgi:dipeptide/tripeptide permease